MRSARELLKEVGYDRHPLAPGVLQLMNTLVEHPVYTSVKSVTDAKVFMQYQVWCVWDFMCLAKSVQIGLGSYTVPWIPPKNTALLHAVNGILQGEETDIGPDGKVASHMEIFIAAMDEAGAPTDGIRGFIRDLQRGKSFADAVANPRIPGAARTFMENTMKITKRPLPSQVACFCLTREELVPRMFGNFLQRLRSARKEVPTFLWYLRRHVELDTETHGPLSRALLAGVVGDDPKKLENALVTVSAALKARRTYLDATCAAIRAGDRTVRRVVP